MIRAAIASRHEGNEEEEMASKPASNASSALSLSLSLSAAFSRAISVAISPLLSMRSWIGEARVSCFPSLVGRAEQKQ